MMEQNANRDAIKVFQRVVEYILRAILFVQAVVSLIAFMWFVELQPVLTTVKSFVLMVSAFFVSLVRLESGNIFHVLFPGLGAISSAFFMYDFWLTSATYDGLMVKAYYMLVICCIFLYFSISRIIMNLNQRDERGQND